MSKWSLWIASVSLISFPALAAPTAPFICTAQVQCSENGLPSTQDLPTLQTPFVRADNEKSARVVCEKTYRDSYSRLLRSVDPITSDSVLRSARGCTVNSGAVRSALE